MSLAKFKQVLIYLGVSISLIFSSVGISNANTFTVYADVGCDPMSDPGTSGSLDEVSTPDTLDFGTVEQNQTESINFTITATSPVDCAEEPAIFEDAIDITFGGDDSTSLSTDDSLDTSSTSATVFVIFPAREGPFTATITFTHAP